MDWEEMAWPPLWSYATNDIEEVEEEAAKFGWDIQYTQHGTGPKGCTFRGLVLPGLMVGREVYRGGTVISFSLPKAFTPFSFPMTATDDDRMNGIRFAAGDIISNGGSSETSISVPRGCDMLTLSLEPEAMRDLADLAGSDEVHDLLRTGTLRLRIAFQVGTGVQGFLASLLQEEMWPPSSDAKRARAMAASALERLAAVVTDVGFTELESRRIRLSVWVQHAHRARAFLEENLDRAVTLAELCRITGTSARTIQYAFRYHYGVAPRVYHKARRLGAVRQTLKRGWPQEMTVTEAASDHGFWHLGRFSQAYKTQFGESPSETLARRPPMPVRPPIASPR